MLQLWLISTVFLFGPALCYPSGPPTSACKDLIPTGHNATAQNSTPPFDILASQNQYAANDKINVTVIAQTADMYFEGVFLQARRANCGSANQDELIGTWEIMPEDSDVMKQFTCDNPNDAVSHKEEHHYHNKTFTWTAPAAAKGHLVFKVTIVKGTKTFWVGHTSVMISDSTASACVAPGSTTMGPTSGAAYHATNTIIQLIAVTITYLFM